MMYAVQRGGLAVDGATGEKQVHRRTVPDVSPPGLVLRGRDQDPEPAAHAGVPGWQLVRSSRAAAAVAKERRVLAKASAKPGPQQRSDHRVSHVVLDPDAERLAAPHHAPNTGDCPRRLARTSSTMSRTPWTMTSVVTTVAIVPVAAAVATT